MMSVYFAWGNNDYCNAYYDPAVRFCGALRLPRHTNNMNIAGGKSWLSSALAQRRWKLGHERSGSHHVSRSTVLSIAALLLSVLALPFRDGPMQLRIYQSEKPPSSIVLATSSLRFRVRRRLFDSSFQITYYRPVFVPRPLCQLYHSRNIPALAGADRLAAGGK